MPRTPAGFPYFEYIFVATACDSEALPDIENYKIHHPLHTIAYHDCETTISVMESPDDTGLDIVGITDPEKFKQLTLHNTEHIDIRVCPSGSDVTTFYVNNTTWTLKGPHITLHHGAGKTAPVIGVSHLTASGNATVGLGDPGADMNAMVWEQLGRQNKWKRDPFQFEFPFDGERKKFTWTRMTKIRFNLQLVEDSNPDVVLAAYVPAGLMWRKRGRILIRMGYEEPWEKMVLLTAISIVELGRKGAG